MPNYRGTKRTARLVRTYDGPIRIPNEKVEPKAAPASRAVSIAAVAPSGAHARLKERRNRSG